MVEMESWSWPPRYDDSYRPQSSSRYWFPRRETMPPGDREKAIVERLRQVCQYAYDHSSFYKKRWDEAGFHPEQVKSLEDFERKCPVIAKSDLRKAQEAYPPFGDRKSTRLNSSHSSISYAVFCLKKKSPACQWGW